MVGFVHIWTSGSGTLFGCIGYPNRAVVVKEFPGAVVVKGVKVFNKGAINVVDNAILGPDAARLG